MTHFFQSNLMLELLGPNKFMFLALIHQTIPSVSNLQFTHLIILVTDYSNVVVIVLMDDFTWPHSYIAYDDCR